MGFWVQVSPTRHRFFATQEAYDRFCGRGREVDAPTVIDDTMEPTQHPATGQILESKREFRRQTRAAGCVELDGMNMNPGPKEIKIDHYTIGKQIHDLMEANHVSERDIKRDVSEFLRRKG